MTEVLLDSSALLAVLHKEPGADVVTTALGSARMSAVNYTEVLTKLIDEGLRPVEARYAVDRFECETLEADKDRAALAGDLHAITRGKGVSLADRFCLALARELRLPVLTTDRRWKDLDLGVEVRVIR
jgi:PIN domain nuclease of toxin-antitoxin system